MEKENGWVRNRHLGLRKTGTEKNVGEGIEYVGKEKGNVAGRTDGRAQVEQDAVGET